MDKPIYNPNDAAKNAAEASVLSDFDPEDIKVRGRERLASRVRDL